MSIPDNAGTLARRFGQGSAGLLTRLGAPGEFFRYHGIYAPGVRLLRSLSIPQKVMAVALCFMLPIGLLAHGFLSEVLSRRNQTQMEMAGALYAQRLLALTEIIRAARRRDMVDASGADPALVVPRKGDIPSRLADLVEVDQRMRAVLQTGSRFDAARQAVQRLATPAPAELEPRMQRYSQAIVALNTLLRHVTDTSRLKADHEVVSLYLVEAAFELLPDTIERMATLRSTTVVVLNGQADDATRMRAMQRLALAQDSLARSTGLLNMAAARESMIAGRLALAAALTPAQGFLAQSQGLLDGSAPPASTAAYVATSVRALDAMQDLQSRAVEQVNQRLDVRAREIDRLVLSLVSAVAVCVMLAVYLLLAFYRVMNGGLGLLQQQVSRMAEGDLSARPRPWGSDEVAQALASLGDSLARLADLFAAVKQGVAAITHASTAIATGTGDLSARTDESVAGVAQILRGVESYVEQLEQSGRRVDEAVEAVHALRLDSTRSRHHMQRLEERMQSLRGKSRQISEIVELIDHIAFRTNILALNASVEASKAGEAGRSFAVVAQEVRNLAARSAEAARRVNTIVTGSTEDIEQSGALVELTATALVETDGHVARIHESMNDIVTLTRSGQQNSQEILGEIRGVNELSSRNRALVEQMANAADDLSRQGDRLNDKVRGFKLS
jgi:methyl-accepting chemotaxis protein